MPAPESRLIKVQEKRPFAPVDTAIRLYVLTERLCMKMPRRYTYLILKPVIKLAGKVMDNAKMANSVFPANAHEAQMRRDYWIKARANLQALSTRVNRFIEASGTLTYHDEAARKTKGITEKDLGELADLILQEQKLIKDIMETEKERYRNL